MTDHDEAGLRLPSEPIDRLIGPLERFMHVEAAGGVVLLCATTVALVLANSPWAEGFLGLWQTDVGFGIGSFQMSHSLKHWINDGLMTVFFFVIGLEVKRELVIGELRDLRNAALPIAGALGGMVVPALIYLAFHQGGPAESGWGIPMATDIAFVIGCLTVLGPRIPLTLRVLLVSLAIADDVGAILVIAVGYTANFDGKALLLGVAGIGVVAVLARLGVRSLIVYTVTGVLVWLAFHESGVHATIAGVVLGLLTPARSWVGEGFLGDVLGKAHAFFHGGGFGSIAGRAGRVQQFRRVVREAISPLEYLEDLLHPWVGFVIMPLFALCNAGVPIHLSAFGDPVALAVAAGLVVGKPLGIVAFGFVAVRLGLARLPAGVSWPVLTGAGALAGIGFTMSLFIAGLALDRASLDTAKVGILVGSAVAAVTGVLLLLRYLPRPGARAAPAAGSTGS